MHVTTGEAAQRRRRDARLGRTQARVGSDDVDAAAHDAVAWIGNDSEPTRICQLAPEVQSADERERLPQRGAATRAQLDRQRELSARREYLFGSGAPTVGWGQDENSTHQNPQRSNTAPTVKPAPTDASRTTSPFFNLPENSASFNARGIVAAVVLPKRSMLITTCSESRSRLSAAARMIRRFAWCDTNRSRSDGLRPFRSSTRRAISSVFLTANLNTARPSCFT